ncbi:MAG: 16S rRNA (cytosine(967)-C(5))-methyltransferase RsmB [bacterium]
MPVFKAQQPAHSKARRSPKVKGSERDVRNLGTARGLSVGILIRADEESAYLDILLAEALKGSSLSLRDRHLVTAITYGVLRYRNQLDWWIEQVASRPVAEMPAAVKAILRSGVYQLLFLSRVPPSAAINEAVNLTYNYGRRGVAGFVNAILRQLHRRKAAIRFPAESTDPVRHIALVYAHPEWMVRRWIQHLGREGCKALCQANNRQPRLTIRLNTLKMPVEQAILSLAQELQDLQPSGIVPEGWYLEGPRPLIESSAFREGYFEIQGLSSMLAVRALAPRPEEKVLDACAGRGGKTTFLAQLMDNRGFLLALDPSFRKLGLLRENSRRLGAGIIREVCADARFSPVRSRFDRLLLDVPCSSLGIIRRHPEIKWIRTESDLASLSSLQLGILEQGSCLVAEKGVMLYSACTLEPEETSLVVNRFLDQHPAFIRDDVRPYLPEPLRDAAGEDGYVRIYPHRYADLDGFFIARLKKRQS